MKQVYYTYKGFYRDSSAIYTTNKGQHYAQVQLAKMLKAKKSYEVAIGIVEIEGKPYYHNPTL